MFQERGNCYVRGAKPLSYLRSPFPLIRGRGIKRVPRKIEDFSGCLKGDGVDRYSLYFMSIPANGIIYL